MNKLAILGAGALGVMATGCIYVDGKSANWSQDTKHGWDPAILGAVIGDQSLEITAPSNGCTEKSSLDLGVEKKHNNFYIHVNRTKQDYCKANLPDGVEIEYTFQELGIPSGATVQVKNKIRG